MKKRLMAIISLLIIAAIGVIAYKYIAERGEVVITFSDDVSRIEIYDKNKKNIQTVEKSSESITLPFGEYFYKPTGANIEQKEVPFIIDGPQLSINSSPNYSKKHLAHLLEKEKETIEEIIKQGALYKKGDLGFKIETMKLFGKGNVAGANLIKTIDNADIFYKVILEKKDSSWNIVGYPRIVLTKYNTPNIDIDILTEINNL